MHISLLNEPSRGQFSKLDKLLDEQLQNQQGWRKELGIKKEEVDTVYAFIQWCDRLSSHPVSAGTVAKNLQNSKRSITSCKNLLLYSQIARYMCSYN